MRRTLLLLVVLLMLAGCASDNTLRTQWGTWQRKDAPYNPCQGTRPADTNSNSMFGANGAVP